MLEYVSARPALWGLLVVGLLVSLRCLNQVVSRLRPEGARHLAVVGDDGDPLPQPKGPSMGQAVFLVAMLLALLLLIRSLSETVGMRWLSHVAFGVVLLPLLTMHVMGLRAWAVMRLAAVSRGMTGRLVQEPWVSMRVAALEQAAFAGLYLVLALLAAPAFFAGGAVTCGCLALLQWRKGGIPPAKMESETGGE